MQSSILAASVDRSFFENVQRHWPKTRSLLASPARLCASGSLSSGESRSRERFLEEYPLPACRLIFFLISALRGAIP